jgi:hypothetical protein
MEGPIERCQNIDFGGFALSMIANKNCTTAAKKSGVDNGLRIATRRLESSVFGVVEEFDASMCLMRFQLGNYRSLRDYRAECDCRGNRTWMTAHKNIHGNNTASSHHKEMLSLDDVRRIEAAMQPHKRLYALALEIFYRRVRATEQFADVKLLCSH